MSTTALVTEARAHGIALNLENGQLRVIGVGAAPPDLVARLRASKSQLVELLTSHASSSDPGNLPALVEKVGVRMQYVEMHRHEWDEAEWERRLAAITKDQEALDAALKATGRTVEECGWTVTREGYWVRVSQELTKAPETRAETLIRAANVRVAGSVSGREIDGSGQEWEFHDHQIAAAALDDDPFEVEAACRRYVEFAEQVSAAAPLHLTTEEGTRLRGERLFQAARAADFPRLPIRPGVYVAGGEDCWRRFSGGAGLEDLAAAGEALTALSQGAAELTGISEGQHLLRIQA